MKIRFMGLISHVLDTNNKNVAVLIKEANHVARFVVPVKDTVGGDPDDLTNRCFDLDGKDISFSLAGGVDRTGFHAVASLSDIGGAGGVLHPDLIKRVTGNLFRGFVEIDGGFYSVADYFEEKASFNGGKSFDCLPRTVLFTSTDQTSNVTVSGLPSALVLKPSAVVTIKNLDLRVGAPPHFELHGTIFKPAKTLATISGSTSSTDKCKSGTPAVVPVCPKEVDQDMSVECANSRYP